MTSGKEVVLMPSAVAARVRSLTERLALSQDDVANIVGSTERSVQRWSSGESSPQKLSKQRLLELVAVAEVLSSVIKPEDANLWIFSPNPLLGFDTPAERIKSGDFKTVLALIEALADGISV
jgi:transcriptional regulator with XRE-family HTH domain